MLFKDHLKLVTDAGAVLHLGWDYDAPYNLDPLNGVDVDIQTAQGINQTGTTVERQSVAGVSRTLSVVFWGGHALDNARNFARKLPYYTTGTMYFGDAYFTRFVVQKTPYFSSYTEPRCELMLYSPKPYWYGLTATARVLGGYQPAFSFPVCYDSHTYGIRQDGEAAVLWSYDSRSHRRPGILPALGVRGKYSVQQNQGGRPPGSCLSCDSPNFPRRGGPVRGSKWNTPVHSRPMAGSEGRPKDGAV